MKYAVIVDSSCDLVIENKTENNIYMDILFSEFHLD